MNIILQTEVKIGSEKVIPRVYTVNSTLGEILTDPKGKAIIESSMAAMRGNDKVAAVAENAQGDGFVVNKKMMAAAVEAMLLRQILGFVPGISRETLEQLVTALNA